MSKQTSSKQRDILSTQLNAEETHKENSSRSVFEPIENTPFKMVCENEKWFITIGINRISPTFDTAEQVMNYIQEQEWNVIFNMIILLMKTHDLMKNQIEEEWEKTKQKENSD